VLIHTPNEIPPFRQFQLTSIQQHAALQRHIWQIANDVRSSVDGWDFKQYVLGTLFYRFISENFAASIDYDVSATATKRFFAAVQNKIHYAVHCQTAAEVIVDRTDQQKQNMGLTTWQDPPAGKIQRFDVAVAKNYLTDGEHLTLAIPLSPTYPFSVSLGSWNPVKTRDSERCGNWSQCPIKPIRFDG
jgi:hypothetical protein